MTEQEKLEKLQQEQRVILSKLHHLKIRGLFYGKHKFCILDDLRRINTALKRRQAINTSVDTKVNTL